MTDDDHTDAPNESHDEDDLQLKQMRSVWLSMRDDDQAPSDRGMAALMAAAREQAEAMKPKRSWWAVLLEQLRRPPVLAMATAVVLIGGAVVISQRDDAMKTESEMADSPPADKTIAEPTTVATPSRDDGAKLDEAPGAEMERDRGGAAMGSSAVVPPAEPVVTQRPRPNKPKPPRSNGPTAGESGLVDHVSMAPVPPADPKPETKKEDAKAPLQLATGDEDLQPKGTTVTESTSAGQAPEHKPVTRKPLPAIEGEDRAAKDASVAQLIKQCEAAAAKNDCAAVRTIAAKIARQDPQTYKNRVMKNAKVAQCLEPPAPMEAAPTSAD